MAITSVDSPGMQRAAEDFQHALSTSNKALDAMQGEIASLGSSWHGDASGAFGRALQSWCTEFRNVCAQLRQIHEAVQTARGVYDHAESGNTEAAAQFQSLVNF